MIRLDAQTAANAKVHLETNDGQTFAVVDVYNFDPAIRKVVSDALPTEKPVFQFWDKLSYRGPLYEGPQLRSGYDPSIFRSETKYLGMTADGWDHHQMRVEVNDPAVFMQHLSDMGVTLAVPTSTYAARGVTAYMNAAIDTVFIG
ncbi:MAG: hypothetical protein HY903_18985 [Deltaproteobacteria bacterium]|nr:hypothetical protein [Deltaproteobacteria bacterium]